MKKIENNFMELKFKAISENERFARACVASFCLPLDPTIDELNDVKTAVSEAVTNCVVHAYPNKDGDVTIRAEINNGVLKVVVADKGIGIKDFAQARSAFYTSKPEQCRSGMGFTLMEAFMDDMQLENNDDCGLKVTLTKNLLKNNDEVVDKSC